MSSLRINKRYTTIPMSVVQTTIPTLSQYFSLRPTTSGFRHNRTSASSLTDRVEIVNHLPTGNAIVLSDRMVRSPVIIFRFRSMYIMHKFRIFIFKFKNFVESWWVELTFCVLNNLISWKKLVEVSLESTLYTSTAIARRRLSIKCIIIFERDKCN